jgi:hypothetical protein
MTSERMIEDFAEYLFLRDNPDRIWPGVDGEPSYMIEAQIFLAGELGQQLQHGAKPSSQVIVNHFVEEGLDPSYMSYEEIAAAVIDAQQLQARVDATWKTGQ